MFDNVFFEYLKWTFGIWSWPDLSTDDGKQKGEKLLRYRSMFVMTASGIALILVFVLFSYISANIHENILNKVLKTVNFLTWEKSFTFSDLLWVCFFFFIIGCFTIFFFTLGIKKNWIIKHQEELVDIHKIIRLFDDRDGLDSKNCLACEKYSDSEKLIIAELKVRQHKEYIEYFQKATGLKAEALNKIVKDYLEEPSKALLLCVLSNPDYFTPKSDATQLRSLTHYFIYFYPQLCKGRKQIKRIFSKSVIGKKTDQDYKDKVRWLFHYLLINYITGVDTCLLLNENGLNCKMDYVIGKYPGNNGNLFTRRVVYLSYEDKKDTLLVDGTIVSEDQLFANVLESDFYDRWDGNIENKKTGGVSFRDKIIIPNINITNNKKKKKLTKVIKERWDSIVTKLELDENDYIIVCLMLAAHIWSHPDTDVLNIYKKQLLESLQSVFEEVARLKKNEIKSFLKEIENNVEKTYYRETIESTDLFKEIIKGMTSDEIERLKKIIDKPEENN